MGKRKKAKQRPKVRKKQVDNRKKTLKAIVITAVCLIAFIAFLMMNPNTKDMFGLGEVSIDAETIKFSELYTMASGEKTVSEKIKALDGKKVKIRGFMAEQSPVDESFIYFVNAPFTVCPFCVITDSTKLEVLTVYMANKSRIKYTTEPVEITGTIEVAEKADEVFGEVTQFRIYADKINILKDDGTDKEVVSYFNQMNEQYAIALINIAYVNIEDILFTKMIEDVTISDAEKYEFFKNRYYSEYVTEGIVVLEDMARTLRKINPTNPKINNIHSEFIKLFEDEAQILKGIDSLCSQMDSYETEEDISEFLQNLKALIEQNRVGFENFTKWNNSIRE